MSKILTDNIIPELKSKVPKVPITTDQIANKAVTAPKADVAGIMNSAGANRQLFGLGGTAINMENTNFNDYPWVTGFFMGHDGANQPPKQVQANDNWWYVEQIVHNDSYGIQIARSFFDASQFYQRVRQGGTWGSWDEITSSAQVLNQTYPVGSVFISLTLSTPEQVTAALGGGTWIRVFKGMAIVGVNEGDSDFNVANKGGGAKTVTLTTNQIPAHTHPLNIRFQKVSSTATGTATGNWLSSGSYFWGGNTQYNDINVDANAGSTGGGQAHNNLQPYATTYIYQRTA